MFMDIAMLVENQVTIMNNMGWVKTKRKDKTGPSIKGLEVLCKLYYIHIFTQTWPL